LGELPPHCRVDGQPSWPTSGQNCSPLGRGNMRRATESESPTPVLQPPLTISAEQVCFVILKAREVETRGTFLEPDPESNPSDDNEVDVLEDHGGDPRIDDPVIQELASFVDGLSDAEKVDLMAL